MRKTIFGLVVMMCMLSLSVTAADTRVPAGDKSKVSFTGRVQRLQDGGVRYDWAGVYMQTRFTGRRIAAVLSDEGKSYHNVFIDGKWVKKIKTEGKEPQQVVLADKLPKGEHTLRLQKCTEGRSGCTTIHALVADKGATLAAVPPTGRFIEVIGDSYTCGYGTESNNYKDPFSLETENCDLAYPCIIARYFGADYAIVAHSGEGLVRHWCDPNPTSANNMPQRWTRVFDDHGDEPYAFDGYKPQLVIVNLGDNDFSPSALPPADLFVQAYVKLIGDIRAHYGQDTPVLCMTPHSATVYLKAAMALLRDKTRQLGRVYMANPLDGTIAFPGDLGAAWHPNYKGQSKTAMALIPQIATIMGWDVETF